MSLINKCVAFWRFEEDAPGPAVDETGRGNDLYWNAGGIVSPDFSDPPIRQTGVLGYGVGYSFMHRDRTSDFDFSQTSFTFGGWCYFRTSIAGRNPILAFVMEPIAQDMIVFSQHLDNFTCTVDFQLENTDGDGFAVTSGVTTLDEWHYLRIWCDIDEHTINIQIDCETPVSAAFTGYPKTDTNFRVWLGRMGTSWPYTYNSFDAWGLWHRVLDTGEAEDLCAGIEYPFGICGYLAFGDHEFGNLWHPVDDNLDWQIPSIKASRRHGGHSLAATLKEKRLTVRGAVVKGPMTRGTIVRTDLDTLRGALGQQPQNLYYEPDRYWRQVRAEYFRNIYAPTHYCRIADSLEIGFVTSDPFQYAVDESTDTWSSPATGGTRTITVGGNAPAQPTFDITVGGTGSQTIAFTIENQTTAESFTLIGDVTGGQEITVNTLEQTVTIGTTDEMDLFEGQFPQFNGDTDNVLEVTITSGSITSIVTTWRNRWY